MITCSSQSQSAAYACVIQQQGTHTLNQQPDAVSCICMCDTGACGIHTLMQQPDTVSCMCMWDTATRHPYPHATARHSQLHVHVGYSNKAPILSCNSQTQSAACACGIQQSGTHTLMQQPDTVSCMCMWDTATRHPYSHATARHSQLHVHVGYSNKAPIPSCNSQTQSAACACGIQQQGTHTLMQQPDTVSCMCMWDTATRHPYPHATARHSQLHLLGRTAHDLVQLEEVRHVLLSGTALLHPSPAHVTVC